MPEAPEVEAVAIALWPLVRGKRIARVRVRHAIAAKPQTAGFLNRKAAGAQILDVGRRGKYLLLMMDRGCLTMHFKFDGQLLWFDGRDNAQQRELHWDIGLEFENGMLAFVDRRHLGRVHWLSNPEDSPGIRALGVDAFSRQFTLARFTEICQKHPRPIKLMLMDQARIAGVGNIYSSEALWHARLSPFRQSNRLSSAELRRLHKAVVWVLARALECCLNPPPDFRNSQWWFSGLEQILRVYGREGLPCRRCGSKIRRVEQSGRSTYYCPQCQRR